MAIAAFTGLQDNFENDGTWFVELDGTPLSKRFVELKNNSRQDRRNKLRQYKGGLVTKLNSIQPQITNISPQSIVKYTSYKSLHGIWLDSNISELEILQIKSINVNYY